MSEYTVDSIGTFIDIDNKYIIHKAIVNGVTVRVFKKNTHLSNNTIFPLSDIIDKYEKGKKNK